MTVVYRALPWMLSATLALFTAGAAFAEGIGEGITVEFSKAFSPDTIGPGSVSRLQFDIVNSQGAPVTDLAFSDTLPAGVTIATPANASTTCTGATLTAPAGGGTITFTGGGLAASGSCRVRVDVTSATPGTHMNVSGDLTSSAGNSGTASADLTVATDRPGFSKSFAPSSVPLGGRSTLTFTIDNTANSSVASLLDFTDTLPAGLVVAGPANASTTCTGGMITAMPGSGIVAYTFITFGVDASVGAFSTCTVSVDVIATGGGTLNNVSGELTSFSGVTTRSSGKASAVLTSTITTLSLDKDFLNDPVPPGGTVTLRFTIRNFDRDFAASLITFTDDLNAALTGLAAVGLPLADPCGAGSQLTGTTLLTLTGGSLAPEASCTFNVTLQVPAAAAVGNYTNTTSAVSGEINGDGTTGNAATDPLFVSPAPLLTKSFTDDPVGAGNSVTLEFTITNTSLMSSVTDLAFLDELTTFLPFPVSVTLPADGFCGAGSSLDLVSLGTERQAVSLTAGNLAAGASCTFQVTIDIPIGFPTGTYLNATGAITGTVNAMTVTGNPATDDLVVVAAPMLLKEFTDDPVDPGAIVNLQFTLTHDPNAPTDATGITFTDDLNAALAGLAAVGLPINDVCGTGSQIAGTTLLTFTGGTLMPGASCTFSVPLQVPVAAVPGLYSNTTSTVTATVGGETATELPASDTLRVAGLQLTKEFTDDPVIPGGTVTLQFTIANVSPATAMTDIFFQDDLDDVLTGLVATGLPLNNICGAGSSLAGSAGNTLLTFSGGNLTAGTSCTFSVTLQVPAAAMSGSYINTTEAFRATIGGSTVIFDNASDRLIVDGDQLLLAKSFLPAQANPGDTVTLRLSVTNTNALQSATGITFSDNLSAALAGLTAVGLPASNVCGAGSQIAGTTTVTLTGGNLGPGATCTFDVTVQVPPAAPTGTFTNVTSQATGTIGGLGVTGDPATANLRLVNITFSKSFDGPTTATGTAVLTFTLQNLDGAAGVTDLTFGDNLGAVLPGLVAVGLPASNVCGTGSQLTGSSMLAFNGGNLGPGGSCSFNVTVQVPAGTAPGAYLNTTTGLFSQGLSVSSPATATLTIEPPPTFAKAFAPAATGVGLPSTLTFTIDNSASAVAATGLAFTDNLPGGVTVAAPANASTTCTGGTVTATPGSGVVSYTGGSVAAGATCTVQADVAASVPGTFVNTSGDLTSSSGTSGTASATLTVDPPPAFAKVFAPDPIAPGGVSTLTFTIDNSASGAAATSLDFTDSLPAAITVATPANASTTCTGGTVTAAAGAGSISYTGGSVAAGATCTVQADVTSSTVGTHVNLSGALTSSLGSSGTATDSLTVVGDSVVLTKAFLSAPVLRGGSVDLEFTITNTGAFALTGIAFTDDLNAVVPGLAAVGLPAADVCGAGSQIAGTTLVSFTGGSLPVAGSCTFSITVQVPAAAPLGLFTNTTSPITAQTTEAPTGGPAASADIEIAYLSIEKFFSPSDVVSGGTTSLVFFLSNPDPVNGAIDVGFTDDLDAVLPGLTAIDTPLSDPCGAGSQLTGTSLLTLTGGSLGPGADCTFSATLQLPGGVPSSSFLNVTSVVTATVGGNAVSGDADGAAQAVLTVSGIAVEIPVLGPWGFAVLIALLALLGLRSLRRQRLAERSR